MHHLRTFRGPVLSRDIGETVSRLAPFHHSATDLALRSHQCWHEEMVLDEMRPWRLHD
jgi:hypothetical protein